MAMGGSGKTKGARVRVHFENDPGLGPVFALTRERVDAALKRNPRAARVVDVSFGIGGKRFEQNMRDVDVLYAWRFPKEKIRKCAPRLRWIHIHGAGVEHLRPFSWMPEKVHLTNSRGVHGDRANEYFLMTILMLNNRVPAMVSNQIKRRWEQVYNTAIGGKTLLVVGVGHMGGGAAHYAKKVGLRVIGIRRTGRPHPHVDEMHKPDKLPQLLPRADFVLCAAPLTSATEHLIGRREIAAMKRGAGIVNVGRAGIIDHAALAAALRSGKLSGAVLDVLPQEPLPSSSPLWRVPNLVITPHSSSDDEELYTPRSLDLFFENVVRFAAGRKLRNEVNREIEY